jgi:hypothetical protein
MTRLTEREVRSLAAALPEHDDQLLDAAGMRLRDVARQAAGPAAGLMDAGHLGAGSIAAVPGIPSASTAAAQRKPGSRHIHEPLAVGVTVMAARALVWTA